MIDYRNSHSAVIMRTLNAGVGWTSDITARTGIPRHIVQIRLHELMRRKMVSSLRVADPYRHGNEKFYTIRMAA